jgi:hypothetical protein
MRSMRAKRAMRYILDDLLGLDIIGNATLFVDTTLQEARSSKVARASRNNTHRNHVSRHCDLYSYVPQVKMRLPNSNHRTSGDCATTHDE